MRIATFNVMNLNEKDCTEKRLQQLIDYIHNLNADIIMLQEVGSVDMLERLADDYNYIHVGETDVRGIGCAIISKVEIDFESIQFDLNLSGYITEAGLGDLSRHKGRSLVQGVVQYNNKKLLIIGSHLKSGMPMTPRDSDGNALERDSHARTGLGKVRAGIQRLAQAYFIRTYLDNIFVEDQNAQVIVCGDFNDSQNSLTHTIMMGQKKFFEGPGTMYSADRLIDYCEFTQIKSSGEKKFIDSILYSESLSSSVDHAEVYNDHLKIKDLAEYDNLVSDHGALLVELK